MTTFTLAPSEPGLWKQIFNFDSYGDLLSLLHNSVIAGAVLGIIGGLISVFVMMRDLPFAVHGISELSFAGAAGALLIGVNVVVGAVTGSLLAAVVIGAQLDHRRADAVRARFGRAVPVPVQGPIGEQVRAADRPDRRD